jgi:hypothetical protein
MCNSGNTAERFFLLRILFDAFIGLGVNLGSDKKRWKGIVVHFVTGITGFCDAAGRYFFVAATYHIRP